MKIRETLLICLIILSASVNLMAGQSPLITAAQKAETAAAKTLIGSKVDLNAVDNYGWSALMHAVYYQSSDIVDLLLSAGADPNIQSTAPYTAYMPAGMTAVGMCGYFGWPEVAAKLLRAKANPELKDSTGNNILTYATKSNFTEVLALLKRASK